MTKQENGSSVNWDCAEDYEEQENPWIKCAERRPEDGQRCLVWPGYTLRVYLSASDSFELDSNMYYMVMTPVEYWTPLPDPPLGFEDPYPIEGSLMEVFAKEAKDVVKDAVQRQLEQFITSDNSLPLPRIAGTIVKPGGEIEFDIEIPIDLDKVTFVASGDNSDGNDS